MGLLNPKWEECPKGHIVNSMYCKSECPNYNRDNTVYINCDVIQDGVFGETKLPTPSVLGAFTSSSEFFKSPLFEHLKNIHGEETLMEMQYSDLMSIIQQEMSLIVQEAIPPPIQQMMNMILHQQDNIRLISPPIVHCTEGIMNIVIALVDKSQNEKMANVCGSYIEHATHAGLDFRLIIH